MSTLWGGRDNPLIALQQFKALKMCVVFYKVFSSSMKSVKQEVQFYFLINSGWLRFTVSLFMIQLVFQMTFVDFTVLTVKIVDGIHSEVCCMATDHWQQKQYWVFCDIFYSSEPRKWNAILLNCIGSMAEIWTPVAVSKPHYTKSVWLTTSTNTNKVW